MSYGLVLLPFAAMKSMRAGQLAGAGMIVDGDFVRFVHLADEAAAACGIVMLVNSTFRRMGDPVVDARVPPAPDSQHYVGRAIDADLSDHGRIWNSGLDNAATAIAPARSAAVAKFLARMTQAGFRWGGVWARADRVHWDAWIDPKGAEYQAKYKLFQSQDLSSVPVASSSGRATPAVPAPLPAPSQPPPVTAGSSIAIPGWLAHDVQRNAAWLPPEVGRLGVEGAYRQRWHTLPADIQAVLTEMAIPQWMIALVPTDAGAQDEIQKQFRFMGNLAGDPPAGPIASRIEQILVFGGSAQLPTPGDAKTGASLGPEGCTAAMAKYVLAEIKREFPQQLAWMSDALTLSQYSPQMLQLFQDAARQGHVRLNDRPFSAFTAGDVRPGSLMVARKPGGTHVFGWTRVPAGWNWDFGDKMAIGNTGLPQFGDRMILAQEYVTDHPEVPGELTHNEHGPINSNDVVYVGGKPDLSDPRTNVYAVQGSSFVTIEFPEAGGIV